MVTTSLLSTRARYEDGTGRVEAVQGQVATCPQLDNYKLSGVQSGITTDRRELSEAKPCAVRPLYLEPNSSAASPEARRSREVYQGTILKNSPGPSVRT